MKQRRSRMTRTRHGKRLEFTPRDIEIFKLLRRYRYLRSTYIHAFVGGASETRLKERLGDLFHEGYLDRPRQQWEFADARCKPVVHELGAGAARTLREHGDGEERACTYLNETAHRQFRHSLMLCEVLACLELGTRASAALRFIGWPEILARAPEATRASPTPFRLPLPCGGFIVPDGVFGIEYRANAAKTYRFFVLEADRGTMPISRSMPGQTSYLAKLAAYGEIIAQRTHKTHWGISTLLVLTVTTSEARMTEMLKRLEGESSAAYLFRAIHGRELLSPSSKLLSDPWQRSGLPPISINA
jgi:hypothetical protein